MQNSFPDMLKILRVHQVNATCGAVSDESGKLGIAVIVRENYREANMSFSVPDGRMAGIANSGSGL